MHIINKKYTTYLKRHREILIKLIGVIQKHEDVPNLAWSTSDLKCILKWRRGSQPSSWSLTKLKRVGCKKKLSYDKIVQPIKKYLKSLKIDKKLGTVININVEYHVRLAFADLQHDVVPLYVEYLNNVERYLEKAVKIDQEQIKLVHGKVIGNGRLEYSEKTLNQAIRYILHHHLLDYQDKYLQARYLVVFRSKGKRNLQTTNWFLGASPYVDMLCKVCDIKSQTPMDDQEAHLFFNALIKKEGK